MAFYSISATQSEDQVIIGDGGCGFVQKRRDLCTPAAAIVAVKVDIDARIGPVLDEFDIAVTDRITRRAVEDFREIQLHHGNDPGKIARMAKINAFHVSLFAEYLEKLKATPEGNGTLLDHSLILYGSGIGNPNKHDHSNLPTILAGGAAGKMKGGRHIRYDEQTPLANLHLTMLNKVGVKIDQFGDSQGIINELLDV